MKITVFSKKISKHDGSKFTGYVTKLKKKDGSEIYCRVRFHEGCSAPRECPAIIAVNKDHANIMKMKIKRMTSIRCGLLTGIRQKKSM